MSEAAAATVERLCYRLAEVQALTGLKRSTLHDLVRRRELEHVRIGAGRRGVVLVPREALLELLERNRVRRATREGA